MSSTAGLSAALVTVVLWASSFPIAQVALRDFSPIPLASMRLAIAATVMVGWAVARGAKLMPEAKDVVHFVLVGAIGLALFNPLINFGQRSISAGATSFIVNTMPVITAILAVVFLR